MIGVRTQSLVKKRVFYTNPLITLKYRVMVVMTSTQGVMETSKVLYLVLTDFLRDQANVVPIVPRQNQILYVKIQFRVVREYVNQWEVSV